MRDDFDADVVIIGGGPVGTTALALLGRAGVTAIALEKDTDVWPTARAVHFDGETFRLLQSLGVAERFVDATLPMASFHIENEAGEVLVRVPTGRFGSQAWHDDLNFHQPDIEKLLREVVADLPGVELREGVEATAVRNVDGGVEVDTIDLDGAARTLRARWAIAADGARSSVRQALGIEGDRFGEDAQWLVVDGHLTGSRGYEDDMIFLGHYSRPALWVRLPGTRVRMEFMLMPGDDPDEVVTPEAIERISKGVLPVGKFEAERRAIYTFRGRIAQRWREGRIFLAGDAAHQAPPLFGQGLCAGMRDAANLAWKMDLIVRGLADESLLDTYESERKPHAQFLVEQAANAAGFVQTTDPEVAAQRDAFLRANPGAGAPVFPPLGPGLHTGDRDERAGFLSVQPLLDGGARLDDRVGGRFLVAAQPEVYAQLDVVQRKRLEASEIVDVRVDQGEVAPILDAAQAAAVIVRPDRYILGAADDAQNLTELIGMIPGIDAKTAVPA